MADVEPRMKVWGEEVGRGRDQPSAAAQKLAGEPVHTQASHEQQGQAGQVLRGNEAEAQGVEESRQVVEQRRVEAEVRLAISSAKVGRPAGKDLAACESPI